MNKSEREEDFSVRVLAVQLASAQENKNIGSLLETAKGIYSFLKAEDEQVAPPNNVHYLGR